MITAITGGIGSGKSYVCQLLENQFGIKIYNCDAETKRLMVESKTLQDTLSRLVGKDLFKDGVFDKASLRQYITTGNKNAQEVDAAVHPAVAEDFLRSGSEWLESAILFESGFDKRVHVDRVICVIAPTEVRIERIMKRDRCTGEQALAWINAQMPQEQKAEMADYVIVNDGKQDIIEQIKNLNILHY